MSFSCFAQAIIVKVSLMFKPGVNIFYKQLIFLFVKYYINHPFVKKPVEEFHIDRNCQAGLELG